MELYDENQIQVLEGLEMVRKFPSMYISSTSQSGLHQLLYEIFENSIDEALAGFCNQIKVRILEGNVIEVEDNGRGIPVGINEKHGVPAVTLAFSVLHASGKFSDTGYTISCGMHGVGASVVNALSEWLEVEVSDGKHVHYQKYQRGKIVDDLKIIGDTDKTGTKVRFLADSEIFETLEYEYEVLLKRIREQALLNGGLSIEISDERDPGNINQEKMRYDGGIREFVSYINKNKEATHEDVIYMSGEKNGAMAEIALQYTNRYDETIISFINNTHTIDNTYETAFKNTLCDSINTYARKKEMLKKTDENFCSEDVLEGIVAIISIKGKANTQLGDFETASSRLSFMNEKLSKYFEENPKIADSIIEKALWASRARMAVRKARESARQ